TKSLDRGGPIAARNMRPGAASASQRPALKSPVRQRHASTALAIASKSTTGMRLTRNGSAAKAAAALGSTTTTIRPTKEAAKAAYEIATACLARVSFGGPAGCTSGNSKGASVDDTVPRYTLCAAHAAE